MTTGMKRTKDEKELKDFTYLGCKMTNNRSGWCFRMCAPDAEGNGMCGRLAPHSMKSKIQLGIERHNKEKELEAQSEECEDLCKTCCG